MADLMPFTATSMNGYGALNLIDIKPSYIDELDRLTRFLKDDSSQEVFLNDKCVHISIGCGKNINHQLLSTIDTHNSENVIILIDGELEIDESKLSQNNDVVSIADIPYGYILNDKTYVFGFKTYMPSKLIFGNPEYKYAPRYSGHKPHQDEDSISLIDKFYDILYDAIEKTKNCNIYNFAVMIASGNNSWGNYFEFYPMIREVFHKSTKLSLYTWIYPKLSNVLYEMNKDGILKDKDSNQKFYGVYFCCSYHNSLQKLLSIIEKKGESFGKFLFL